MSDSQGNIAIVGDEEQTIGVFIEPSDGFELDPVVWQVLLDGGTPLGVVEGCDDSDGLVENERVFLGIADEFAIDANLVIGSNFEALLNNCHSVDLDSAFGNVVFRCAT